MTNVWKGKQCRTSYIKSIRVQLTLTRISETSPEMATHGNAGSSDWLSSIAATVGIDRGFRSAHIDPGATTAYTSSRLVPLDKKHGVCPMGIGEVVRRIFGKAIWSVLNSGE